MTDELDALADALNAIEGVEALRDAPAAALCTYRVGGSLGVLAHVDTWDALGEACSVLSQSDAATLAIGKGSNLLVSDAGFDGVAIQLGDVFTEVEIDAETSRIVAGGAAALPVVARASVGAGLHGFEWAVGVPGAVGGAVRMNAGGHGSDMAASLVSVEIADISVGGFVTRSASSLELDYRSSNIESWHIVASATLQLEPMPEADEGADDDAAHPVGERGLKSIVSWRRDHQPGGANAGSVFTNPPDDSAGRLIDAAGLKGVRLGTAEVSPKHANFIQADPGGSADDVFALMKLIVDRVEETHGVRLHAETHLVGFGAQDGEGTPSDG